MPVKPRPRTARCCSLRLAGGLAWRTDGEMLLHRRQHLPLGAALEHLGDEARRRGARCPRGEIQRQLGQRDDADMVGRGVAGGVRRHVRQHQVGLLPPSMAVRRAGMSGSLKSPCTNVAPGTGSTGSRSSAHHPCRAPRAPPPGVQPPGAAPRSTTRAPWAQQMEPVVQLDQLEGRARAPALARCAAAHIGVVELARAARRCEAALRSAARCAALPPARVRRWSARPWPGLSPSGRPRSWAASSAALGAVRSARPSAARRRARAVRRGSYAAASPRAGRGRPPPRARPATGG